MADVHEPTEAELAVKARHALHDEELVAAFAAGDLEPGPELERTQALVDRCAACRDLHADLVVLRATLQASGTAEEVGARVPAPRDFRLTREAAEGIRPSAPVLRLRTRVALAFAAFARPVGASLATLGLVGLLFGSIGLAGTAGDEPASGLSGVDAQATSGPGPHTGEIAGTPGSTSRLVTSPLAAESPRESTKQDGEPLGFASEGPSMPAIVIGGSIVLLLAGLVLLVASARRGAAVAS